VTEKEVEKTPDPKQLPDYNGEQSHKSDRELKADNFDVARKNTAEAFMFIASTR
jgi:hypothetical protein